MLVAQFIFGLNSPIAKGVLSHPEVSAYALTIFRMGGAAVMFWLVSLFTKREKVSLRDLGLLFLASLFGIQLNQSVFIIGLSMTSPIDASVIATVVPILTMVLAALFLKEPITWKKTLGVFIGAAGALMIILNSTGADGIAGGNSLGNILCLLSSLSYAIYLAAFKGLVSRYSPVTIMKWMFLFATMCCAPFFYQDVVSIDYSILPADIYAGIAFVVVGATFVGYLLIPIGQKTLRPTVVSMYNYEQPLVSALVAVAIGLDTLNLTKIAAAILIFGGVFIVTRSRARTQ